MGLETDDFKESDARNVPPAVAWRQTTGGEGPRRAEEQRLSLRRTWDIGQPSTEAEMTSQE